MKSRSLFALLLWLMSPSLVLAEQPAAKKSRAHPSLHIEKKSTSNTLDALLSNAYQAYQTGAFSRARQSYFDALKHAPQNRDALLGLAAIAQRETPEIAVQYYQRVVQFYPHDATAHTALAALNPADDNAESRLKFLLNAQPESASLNFALGNQYAAQARWNEAQQAFFQAHRLASDNPQFALNLAISLDHLGQPKPARQYYQLALQLDNQHALDSVAITQRIQQLSL